MSWIMVICGSMPVIISVNKMLNNEPNSWGKFLDVFNITLNNPINVAINTITILFGIIVIIIFILVISIVLEELEKFFSNKKK